MVQLDGIKWEIVLERKKAKEKGLICKTQRKYMATSKFMKVLIVVQKFILFIITTQFIKTVKKNYYSSTHDLEIQTQDNLLFP